MRRMEKRLTEMRRAREFREEVRGTGRVSGEIEIV